MGLISGKSGAFQQQLQVEFPAENHGRQCERMSLYLWKYSVFGDMMKFMMLITAVLVMFACTSTHQITKSANQSDIIFLAQQPSAWNRSPKFQDGVHSFSVVVDKVLKGNLNTTTGYRIEGYKNSIDSTTLTPSGKSVELIHLSSRSIWQTDDYTQANTIVITYGDEMNNKDDKHFLYLMHSLELVSPDDTGLIENTTYPLGYYKSIKVRENKFHNFVRKLSGE